jgi:hypothetical protein
MRKLLLWLFLQVYCASLDQRECICVKQVCVPYSFQQRQTMMNVRAELDNLVKRIPTGQKIRKVMNGDILL